MKPKDYSKEEWQDVFQIDPLSSSGLSWKVDGNDRSIGKSVGWLDKSGYWRCEYNGKGTLVHRIIYHLKNSDISEDYVIDHIDGNPLNNSPYNLRQITKAENNRNRKRHRLNKTGMSGVTETHYFCANWVLNGKNESKTFSVLRLGYAEAKAAAEDYRNQKIRELNELGYNYSETNGKRDE